MKPKFIEVTNNNKNWGKFMVTKFYEDASIPSQITPTQSLMSACGWTPHHIMVFDLQTGEGAIFMPGGMAAADLDKHKIWVCPMFEPFLKWLYKQYRDPKFDLDKLPPLLDLPNAEFALRGHRREGV